MIDFSLITHLELLALRAWPPLTLRYYDGWLMGFSAGYTGRANSVQPLFTSSLDVDEKIATCEQLYKSAGQDTIFRLTDYSLPSDLDGRLQQRGYRLRSATPVNIQVASLYPVSIESRYQFRHMAHVSDEWLHTYTRMAQTPVQHIPTLTQMLEHIGPQCCFSLVIDQGQPVAAGLGVLDGDWMGLFDIVVTPEQRRRGIGRALVSDLTQWGYDHGATRAYLQVHAANEAALALYADLGFETIYHYWYRQKTT